MTRHTRKNPQNQNTPDKRTKNTPPEKTSMTPPPTGTSTSPPSTPASSRKSSKARNSSLSLSKVTEAIAKLEQQLKPYDDFDKKLADAFNLLSTAVKEISNHLQNEENLKRDLEDERDDHKQKSLKGKLVITSPKKGTDLVGNSDSYKDEEEVIKATIDLAKKKYKVEIPENEISSCYALKKGGIVLGLWHFGRGSAFQRLVTAIKSNKDVDKDVNVYFNFMLTKKRNTLLYNVRELKRKEGSKIRKFYTDENGGITVLTTEGEKEKITFSWDSRRTINEAELWNKFQ